MLRFFLSRVGQTIAVLFTVSVIIFALMRLIPGDPVLMMLGDDFTPATGAFHVKGFQMIPANLIDMHRVWLDKA